MNRWPVFDTDIYLDESHPDNGGLWGIPGSHLAGYNPDLRNEVIASYTEGKEAGEVPGALPVIAKPGDVNLHANSVVHGSFASAHRACGARCTSTGTTTPTSRCAPSTTSGAASTCGRSNRSATPSPCARAAFRTRPHSPTRRCPRHTCPDPAPSGSPNSNRTQTDSGCSCKGLTRGGAVVQFV